MVRDEKERANMTFDKACILDIWVINLKQQRLQMDAFGVLRQSLNDSKELCQ